LWDFPKRRSVDAGDYNFREAFNEFRCFGSNDQKSAVGEVKMRFKIRSAARDEAEIAHRIGSIERCVLKAITAAETEKKGFARRLEAARGRASVLIGTEQSEAVDREQETECCWRIRSVNSWQPTSEFINSLLT
jgi:hypothetical protein